MIYSTIALLIVIASIIVQVRSERRQDAFWQDQLRRANDRDRKRHALRASRSNLGVDDPDEDYDSWGRRNPGDGEP